MSSTRVLVAGATGRLGQAIVEVAGAQGYAVRALGRSSAGLASLSVGDTRRLDLLSAPAPEIEAAVEGVDAIVSSVGGSIVPDVRRGRASFLKLDTIANQRLIEAAERQGVRRFVYVAVACHDELGHLNYVKAHERVVARLTASRLESSVLRASGFFSAFESVLELAKKGRVPLIGNPEARTNPIADSDLARLCVAALAEPPRERTVGGPEILTRRRIAELAFEALGKPPRFISLPNWLVRTLGALTWPISPRVAELTSFFLEVSSRDCLGEASGTSRLGDYLRARALAGNARPAQLEY